MASEGSSSSSSSKMGGCFDNEVPHVLVVDDSMLDRKLVEKLLKNSSCKVTTADSGMKALEYLGLGDDQQSNSEVLKVNLILSDYCMPGMTGYDLLKNIKASHLKEVPFVIMSSENVPTRINECLEEGAKMFLIKPLQLADIENLKSNVMQRRN